MHTTRGSIVLTSALLAAAACAKTENAATDTTKAPPAAPAPAVTLADFAGKWAVVATPQSGKDTSVTKYTMTATADTSGWRMDFPSGVKVPLQVSLSGDSVLIKTGQFSSQRRKNVKVWTEGSVKLQSGKLVGASTAHYLNAGADSVLKVTIDGTKAP